METTEQVATTVDLKRFITQDFDKFADKSSTKLKWPGKISKQFFSMWYNAGDSSLSDYKGFEIELDMRHVKTPEIDSIVIDYFLTTGDWLFLRNGKMIINIDPRKKTDFFKSVFLWGDCNLRHSFFFRGFGLGLFQLIRIISLNSDHHEIAITLNPTVLDHVTESRAASK